MFGVKKATPLNLILTDELEILQVGEEKAGKKLVQWITQPVFIINQEEI